MAQVYLEAGLLHLEGTAGNLLSASGSYSGLSSIRISTLQIPPPTTTETYNHLSTWGSSGFSGLGSMSGGGGGGGGGGSGAEAWRRDRERARRLFERARRLNGDLDVPLLPPSPDTEGSSEAESVDEEKTELGTRPRSKTRVSGRVGEGKRDSGELGEGQGQGQFRMPRVDIEPTREQEEKQEQRNNEKPIRRRRKREDTIGGGGGRGGRGRGGADSIVEERVREGDEDDNTWYLYLPGLVGAGTALLVVGFLSFSSWRKGQGS